MDDRRLSEAPPGQGDKRNDFQRDLDKARVEALYRSQAERSKFVIDFALLGLRSLVLVNGGALIAMLTFLGHNQELAIRRELWSGFGWLVVGLGAALGSIVCAYLSQQQFTHQEASAAEKIFMNSYGNQAKNEAAAGEHEARHLRQGAMWQYIAIALALLSFGCFARGCYVTLGALVEASASPLF